MCTHVVCTGRSCSCKKGDVHTIGITYNMESFVEDCVSQYVTLTKYNKELRKVPNLFGGRGSEEF